MNENFSKKWIEQLRVPALNKIGGRVVIIINNAFNHSIRTDKKLNFSLHKSDMENWLKERNVEFNAKSTKNDMWALIKPMLGKNDNENYVIETILNSYEHQVLRLPLPI